MLALQGVEMTESLKLYHSTDGTVKGLIFDHNEHKVISNFPTPTEINLIAQLSELSEELKDVEYPITGYSSEEGTLIRVYHFNDEWCISTSSKIDAYQSSWAEKDSFGLQFQKLIETVTGTPLEVFLYSLDTSLKYFFILPTRGLNRLGRLPEEETNSLFLVGIETPDGVLKHGNEFNLDKNLWSYLEEYTFDNISQIIDTVHNKQKNVIIYKQDKLLKCVSDGYKRRCDLRNNEMNIYIRYLQLIKTDQQSCKEFARMYPEVNFFTEVEQRLNLIVKYIHESYMKRYIKREYVRVPKMYYQIMKTCHQEYMSSFEKTTLLKVWNVILSQEPKIILSLIRNFSLNE